jgi:hypothetical protein
VFSYVAILPAHTIYTYFHCFDMSILQYNCMEGNEFVRGVETLMCMLESHQ